MSCPPRLLETFTALAISAAAARADGCVVSTSKWIFAAGLTNVEVHLRVTDTASGQIKTYDNPLGRPFPPIQDTSAFATCP